MKKTLAVVLGGVTLVGIGLFAYLKLRKQPEKLTSDTKSPILPQTPAVASTTPPLVSGLDSVISNSEKQEKENLERGIREQELTRPENLNTIQAVTYAVDYPEALKNYFPTSFSAPKMTNSLFTKLNITASGDVIEFIKKHWVSKGRPSGYKVRAIKNTDETPISLTDDQAIIYLATYPDLRKTLITMKGVNLNGARTHWINNGRSEGKRIDLK